MGEKYMTLQLLHSQCYHYKNKNEKSVDKFPFNNSSTVVVFCEMIFLLSYHIPFAGEFLSVQGKHAYNFIILHTNWSQNWFNPLSPEKCCFDFECVYFKYILLITFMSSSIPFAFISMVQDPTDDKTILLHTASENTQNRSHWRSHEIRCLLCVDSVI